MTGLNLLNRAVTAAALVVLAIALGAWLIRSPLTAVPAATPDAGPAPVKPHSAKPSGLQPTLAPLPLGPAVSTVPPPTVTTEVEIEAEIAPLPIPPTPVVADSPPMAPASPPEKPAVKPAETPRSNCQYYYRRGLFRRR